MHISKTTTEGCPHVVPSLYTHFMLLTSLNYIMQCVVPENIHTTPRKGSDFPGGRGVNLPTIQQGGGVHHEEIFPEGSCDT